MISVVEKEEIRAGKKHEKHEKKNLNLRKGAYGTFHFLFLFFAHYDMADTTPLVFVLVLGLPPSLFSIHNLFKLDKQLCETRKETSEGEERGVQGFQEEQSYMDFTSLFTSRFFWSEQRWFWDIGRGS